MTIDVKLLCSTANIEQREQRANSLRAECDTATALPAPPVPLQPDCLSKYFSFPILGHSALVQEAAQENHVSHHHNNNARRLPHRHPTQGIIAMMSRMDRALLQDSQAARLRWERRLAAQDADRARGRKLSALPRMPLASLRLPAMSLPLLPLLTLPPQLRLAWTRMRTRAGARLGAAGIAWRRVALAGAGVCGIGAALMTGAVVAGYLAHPPSYWQERIAARTHSPIYGSDRTLIGSVGVASGGLSADAAREYAYIPLQGELPPTYLQALLKMENQNYFAGGWHNVCGLDLPATLKRWVASAGAGGSTLSMQLARELKRPDWGNEPFFLQKVWRKALELGASCRLHQMLVAQGGELALLRLYAAYAPTFQGNGTLRGIEAASRIVFDLAPQELSDAQQLILAAAARKPLTLLPPQAHRVLCRKLYPRRANPSYDAVLAKANVARAVQCQILHRALYRAPDVLQGARLRRAQLELRHYQANGVQPVNPFQPLATRRLVNLATRTASAMPTGLLANIREEVEAQSLVPGEALHLTLDAVRQHDFERAMRQSLELAQQAPATLRLLCLPLAQGKSGQDKLPSCGAHTAVAPGADVLAIKVDVASGGIKALYASSPLLLDARQSIGSTAKWVVLVAALAAGRQPQDLHCPQAARDGERWLRRVAHPETGYPDCADGRHLMSWERATAESDNLVFYALARELGQARLAAAARALALGEPEQVDNLAFALSFGTYGATPRALLAAGQAMVSLAYGIRGNGTAPRALGKSRGAANPSIAALKKLLPQPAQREALRRLLEAPVQQESGTLAKLKGLVTAGKTGTIQSAVLAPNGRHYNHGKWNITYQHAQRSLNLFIVSSPLPAVPLAQPEFGFSALQAAHLQILNQE